VFESIAFAQEPGGGTGQAAPSPLGMFTPLILILVIFWFLLIRPQKKKQEKHREMLNNLKKGDRVVTNGGLFGSVIGLTEKKIVLRVADNVKMEFLRGAIQGLANEYEKSPGKEDREEKSRDDQ